MTISTSFDTTPNKDLMKGGKGRYSKKKTVSGKPSTWSAGSIDVDEIMSSITRRKKKNGQKNK